MSAAGPRRAATRARLALLWGRARDSLWFVPTVAALAALALAVGMTRVPPPRGRGELAAVWLFGGGAEGARQVLGIIAGSLITVTGVVFSVTIVALQLASSQFTPRLLRSFVADRSNQAVLGVFIGTFTYTLLVLRRIESTGPGEAFVPQVAVAVAVLLLLVSIGALIFFVNHAARSVQASVILQRETLATLARIDELLPGGAPARREAPPAGEPALVAAETSGYLEAVDRHALARLAEERGLVIRLRLRIGAFAVPGRALAAVWPPARADEATRAAVREACLLGPERTPEQDVEFGIVELSDIACRALSPGINDPTTAMLCVDRLAEILRALAGRCPAREEPEVAGGEVRGDTPLRPRFEAADTTFERAAGLAFDQVRHFGADNPAIAKKMLDALAALAPLVPPEERAVLGDHADAVLRAARRAVAEPWDLRAVERLGEALARTAGGEAGARAADLRHQRASRP